MTAIAFARHDEHPDLLEDPRRRYGPDGRYVPEVVDHLGAQESLEAGGDLADLGGDVLCAPRSLGGVGQGYLAYYVCWEMINRVCGPHHWLGTFALSHWAFGPSPVLKQVTPEARERILAGLMSGRQSMCFGLSEPSAGSDAAMIVRPRPRLQHPACDQYRRRHQRDPAPHRLSAARQGRPRALSAAGRGQARPRSTRPARARWLTPRPAADPGEIPRRDPPRGRPRR